MASRFAIPPLSVAWGIALGLTLSPATHADPPASETGISRNPEAAARESSRPKKADASRSRPKESVEPDEALEPQDRPPPKAGSKARGPVEPGQARPAPPAPVVFQEGACLPLAPEPAPESGPESGEIRLEDYHASPEDIKPLPLVPIPDDPPPHEGAEIVLPYIIQPPDHLHVSVLQGAPGRGLDGDRLVRPDGKLSLDFYGELSVAGLTVLQAKEKVILHLRKHLSDSALGLVKYDPVSGEPARDAAGKYVPSPPAESTCIYVDVQAYNHAVYYVQGDVGMPGKFPHTGHECVLDALNYAGGYLATAEEGDVTLARPARAGKPAKVYKVDMAAIRDRADSTTNYQLFPGDRLIVGRNPVVKASVQLNRLSEPLQILANDIRTFALVMKAINESSVPSMTPHQRDVFLRRWTEFLRYGANRPGGPVLDKEVWEEWLDRFDVPPDPAGEVTPPTPGPTIPPAGAGESPPAPPPAK